MRLRGQSILRRRFRVLYPRILELRGQWSTSTNRVYTLYYFAPSPPRRRRRRSTAVRNAQFSLSPRTAIVLQLEASVAWYIKAPS